MNSFFLWLKSLFSPKPAPASQPTQGTVGNPPPVVQVPVVPSGSIVAGTVHGLDVSHYQGPVDWKLAWSLGNRFMFAKATDGETGKDSMFLEHIKEAKSAGFLTGAYHFFRFEQDPVRQAVNFMEMAAGRTDFMCLDVEWDKTSKKYGEGHEMDDDAADRVFIFLNTVALAQKGYKPWIYTNYYFWKYSGKQWDFSQFPLWISAYHTTIEKVHIPKPWGKAVCWQYADDLLLGNVKEIDGNCFLGSLDDLQALVKK